MLNEPLIKEFFDFVNERQRIYYKRFVLKESPPWTENEMLQKFVICNVFRSLDAGSQFIAKHCAGLISHEERLFAIIVYRFINNWKVFAPHGNIKLMSLDDNQDEFLDALRKFKSLGGVLFNTAFRTFGGSKNRIESFRKVINQIKGAGILHAILGTGNWNDCRSALMKIPHVGEFMAFQIVFDAIDNNLLSFDKNSVDYLGWGAEAIVNQMGNESSSEILNYIWAHQREYLAKDFRFPDSIDSISKMDIEHSLCEFRKLKERAVGPAKRMRKFIPAINSPVS